MLHQKLYSLLGQPFSVDKRRRRSEQFRQTTAPAEMLEDRRLLTDLANGQEIASSIVAGSSASFDLEAQQNDVVRFSVGELQDALGNFFAEPVLQITSPSGTTVDTDTGSANAEVQFTAGETGTYTAIVRDSLNDEALNFRIRAAALPGQSNPGFIANRDDQLANGEEVERSVPLGSFNLFELSAQQNEVVRVSVGEMADSLGNFSAEPLLQIISPTGLIVDSDTGSENAEIQFVAGESGTYTAIVRDSLNDEALNFRIRAAALPGQSSPGLIANRDDQLANGEEVERSVPLGSFNLFELTAQQNEVVRVSVGEMANSLGNFPAEPLLQIISPTGLIVASNTGSANAELQFVAGETGTYTAIVRDSLNDEALSFRIRAAALPGQSAPGLIANRDHQLANGEEVESSFPLGTFNLFELTAQQNEVVRVSVGEMADSLGNFLAEPLLQIISPSGLIVDSDTGSENAEVQFIAGESGTYTAIVRDSLNDEALSFRIRAVALPGQSAPGLIANRDHQLNNGEEVESSFPLGTFNLFELTAQQNEVVRVSVGEIADSLGNFPAEPLLQIISPTGLIVDSDTGSANAELQFVAGETGTYTAIVRDSLNDEALNFRIRAVALPGQSSPSLIAGRDAGLSDQVPVQSSLPLGSFNLFEFPAQQDADIRILVTELANLLNQFPAQPTLQVISPSGNAIAFDTGSADAETEFVAPETGTYSVIVRDSLNDDEMSFSIVVEGSGTTPAGFSISETTAAVSEDTTVADSFSVVLDSQPGSNVVLDLTLSADPDASVAPTSLTFTPTNWNQAQTVTVTGIDDTVVDGEEQTTITISVNDSVSNSQYQSVPDQTVIVTTADNDTAGTKFQHASSTGDAFRARPEGTIAIPVVYRTLDNGNPSTLQSNLISFNLHYDSTVLTFVEATDVFGEGLNVVPNERRDESSVSGDDMDQSTDSVLVAAWTDNDSAVNLGWPNAPRENGLTLYVAHFTTTASFNGTEINFSANETGTVVGVAETFEFSSDSVQIELNTLSGDVDGSGDFDANDAFLIQLVKLAGSNSQIDASKGTSTLTAEQIRQAVNELESVADVDMDGDFDANDAFLIQLVKLAGANNQIDAFKGASAASAATIRANIEALDGSGSTQSARIPGNTAAVQSAPSSLKDERLFERSITPEAQPTQTSSTLESETPSIDQVLSEYRSWADVL